MSILASLVRVYDRLPDAPPFGYSNERIGFVVSLNGDGTIAHVVDLRSGEGRQKQAPVMEVPASFKRPGTTPRPFFLWDNANYALGASMDIEPEDLRFEAFRRQHLLALASETDVGLTSFRCFLERWKPSDIENHVSREHIRNEKVVFALESERRSLFLHQRSRSRELWNDIANGWKAIEGKNTVKGVCLVTGSYGPIARTHPAIRGIPSKGGKDADSIVSFNLDAFTSYGHEQGDNAPVSELAAFKYTTVLNRFLERGSKHRIQIGDASTVFWADASRIEVAEEAEGLFLGMFGDTGAAADEEESKRIGILLDRLRKGEQLESLDPHMSKGVRFHVLGLAPNAARISIRFHFEDEFGVLARNYQRFVDDMRIEPPPRDPYPPIWRYLIETAVLARRENVPPSLSGEWMRSILAGTNYPLTLLSAVLSRIRADGEINALRAGILRAVLVRNFRMRPYGGDKSREAPVSFDPENRNKGYLLGRLFAAYEQAQSAALGRSVNATIKDKFYGSASATPRSVFPLLERGSANHLSKVGKMRPGQRVNLERTIGSIMEAMSPGEDPFPVSLSAADQAMFGLGYYHQRGEFFRKRDAGTEEAEQ